MLKVFCIIEMNIVNFLNYFVFSNIKKMKSVLKITLNRTDAVHKEIS